MEKKEAKTKTDQTTIHPNVNKEALEVETSSRSRQNLLKILHHQLVLKEMKKCKRNFGSDKSEIGSQL